MPEKTKEQLEAELSIQKAIDEERTKNDGKYAIKLTEKIVFGMVGMIAVGFLGFLLALAFKAGVSVKDVIP